MVLFTDRSEEAASYHHCRTAPEGERVNPERLAEGGEYAASLAWAGHVAQHGRPDTVDFARHIAVRAADAFIDETCRRREADLDETLAAKRRAHERVEVLLRAEYP